MVKYNELNCLTHRDSMTQDRDRDDRDEKIGPRLNFFQYMVCPILLFLVLGVFEGNYWLNI